MVHLFQICVPWVGSQVGLGYTEADFLNHVLQQVDGSHTAYKTLSDKACTYHVYPN